GVHQLFELLESDVAAPAAAPVHTMATTAIAVTPSPVAAVVDFKTALRGAFRNAGFVALFAVMLAGSAHRATAQAAATQPAATPAQPQAQTPTPRTATRTATRTPNQVAKPNIAAPAKPAATDQP